MSFWFRNYKQLALVESFEIDRLLLSTKPQEQKSQHRIVSNLLVEQNALQKRKRLVRSEQSRDHFDIHTLGQVSQHS